jgi:hypothetical protein
MEASGAGRRDGSKERRSAKMISVTIEVREATLMRRVQMTAPSIERALEIMGEGKPGRRVHLVFPIDPQAFFVPGDHGRSEAA